MDTGIAPAQAAALDDRDYRFLNPAYALDTIRIFDHERGYWAHHQSCVRMSPRLKRGRLDNLARNGFDLRPALDPAFAAALATRARKEARNLGPRELGQAMVRDILERTLTPEIHGVLNGYFLTEFAVIFMRIDLTEPRQAQTPDTPPEVSFSWHCDGGPSTHLKLLVYLNPAAEHDGATEVLSNAVTAQFKKLGYVFAPASKRLTDLSDLAARNGIVYAPQRLQPDAGEALIFEPAGVLHKGVYPTRGARVMIEVWLVPWVQDWRRFFDANFNILLNNADCNFPQIK